MLRIGELAAASQVTPDTLRYYERLGLLDKPTRSPGGFRLYERGAFEQVRFIKQAQALGLELDEIRQLAKANTAPGVAQCREVQPILRTRLAELDARLSDLRVLRRTLSRALETCDQRLTARSDAACPVVEDLEQLRWPEGFRCPRCGAPKAWPVRRRWWQCAACAHQTSVTAGTIFQDTRTPLVTWFRAMAGAGGRPTHEHLDYYLDEFTFRFHRRRSRSRGKLFFRLVQQAVAIDPAPYESLVRYARMP